MGRFQVVLVSVGICVLFMWTLRRVARPAKLRLRRCPGRPNSLTPLHLLALLAIWIGASAALSGMLKVLSVENSPGPKLLATITQQVVWLAASLIVAAMTCHAGLVRGLGLSTRHWPWDLMRGTIGYLAVLPVCVGLFYLTASLLPEGMKPENWLLELIKTTWPGWQSLLGIFSAVVLASLSEEIFFRGLFQSMLQSYTHNPWLAILTTAAFFALVHIPYWDTLPALLALGVALGYNYARSGRLLAPVVIHAVFNAVNIISFTTGW